MKPGKKKPGTGANSTGFKLRAIPRQTENVYDCFAHSLQKNDRLRTGSHDVARVKHFFTIRLTVWVNCPNIGPMINR